MGTLGLQLLGESMGGPWDLKLASKWGQACGGLCRLWGVRVGIESNCWTPSRVGELVGVWKMTHIWCQEEDVTAQHKTTYVTHR